MFRSRSLLPALCGLLCTLAAAAGAPINVVQVADQSGPNGDTGRDFVTGARVYFDQLNARGGVNGRPVNLVVADDGGEPAATLALSRKLVAEQRPQALFGYIGADGIRAVLADKALAGLPLVAPYLGIDVKGEGGVYYLRAGLAAEVGKIARIAGASGLTRLALVSGEDALGRAARLEVPGRLAEVKAALVGQVGLPTDSIEVEAAAVRLAASNPQGVILAAPTVSSAAFVRAYQALRPGTQFYALSWVNPQTLREFLGPEAVRGVAVSALVPSPYNPLSPIAREFVATLKKYRDEPPSYASLEGYMAARMLADNLRAAGGEGGAPLRRALDGYHADVGGAVLSLRGGQRASRYVDMAVFSAAGLLVN